MAEVLYKPYVIAGTSARKVDIELNHIINISGVPNSPNDWQNYSPYWYQIIKNQGTQGIYTLPEDHYNNILQIANLASLIKKNSGLNFSITSGYRPKGKPGSDHFKGAAIDLFISAHKDRKALFDHIYNGKYSYRQLIWEDQQNGSNAISKGNYSNYPGIIHISYVLGDNKRQTLYSTNKGENGTISPYKPGEATDSDIEDASNKSDQQIAGNDLVGSYNETLNQADLNIQNLEKGEVEETWGMGFNYGDPNNPQRNDWISLKQFLLYLCTRYAPTSVYPFIELIPAAQLSGQDWERDGKNIATENNISNTSLKKKSQTGINTSNKAAMKADLWSLDPYEESYAGLNDNNEWVLSNSGLNVYQKRLTGVRVYSQLVLAPEGDDISPSKPGGIGFTELTINAGAQCDNGIAMITMKLVDLQGNKFTDLNSPWSFIYDARPGGTGGDFYFRFGWQLRLPDPKDKENLASSKFWNHQGWLLFDDSIRQFIANQITASRPYITLTQSMNELPSTSEADKYALFDEGIELLSTGNSITVARTNLQPMNYIKLAILNPEIEVDPDGVITATLNFRTVGALAATIPLLYANTMKRIVKKSNDGVMSLGDFIIGLTQDFAQFEYISLVEDELKKVQAEYINGYLARLSKNKGNRDFSNFVTVIGLEEGGSIGNTNPDDIYITIDNDSKAALFTPDKENTIQLIGWARDVLNSNGMELNSVATGSGAGINSSWVITVGTDFNKDRYEPQIRDKIKTSQYTNALQLMKEEKDIFSFKFQGSLVESIKIEKTEASNALKIETDYAVSDFLPQMNAQKTALIDPKEVTIADRRRNLNILYSQLQNVTITALCHPWIGPGRDFYIKGMGFWDGQYKVLKVTHKLNNLSHFTTEIGGARMIIPSEKEQEEADMEAAAANGQTEKTQPVQTIYSTPATATPVKESVPIVSEESKPVVTTVAEESKSAQNNDDKWAKANDISYHLQNKGDKVSLEKAQKIAKNLHDSYDDNEIVIMIYNKFTSITSASYIASVFFDLYPEEKQSINILADLFDINILKYLKQSIYKLPDEV